MAWNEKHFGGVKLTLFSDYKYVISVIISSNLTYNKQMKALTNVLKLYSTELRHIMTKTATFWAC